MIKCMPLLVKAGFEDNQITDDPEISMEEGSVETYVDYYWGWTPEYKDSNETSVRHLHALAQEMVAVLS